MFSLTPRLTILATGLLALSLAHGAYQSHRASLFKLRADAAQQRAIELSGALGAANATVDRLNAGNRKLIEVATLQREMLDEAAARLDQQGKELQKWKDGILAKEDHDRALPDCQNLLAADLRTCPGHLDGMRARANRLP
jgi:hypothetical protein